MNEKTLSVRRNFNIKVGDKMIFHDKKGERLGYSSTVESIEPLDEDWGATVHLEQNVMCHPKAPKTITIWTPPEEKAEPKPETDQWEGLKVFNYCGITKEQFENRTPGICAHPKCTRETRGGYSICQGHRNAYHRWLNKKEKEQ